MGSWGVWRERAARAGGVPTHGFGINANMATDCSGLGVPELAMRAISEAFGMKYQVVFACDNLPASQAFLQRNTNPKHLLGDIGERVFRTTSFATTDVDGKAPTTRNGFMCMLLVMLWSSLFAHVARQAVIITRAASALDLYVAGAMSGPFASAGKAQGFADYNARTLIQFARSVAVLKPRAAILENAPAILQQRHRKQLYRLLSAVKGYRLKIFAAVDNRQFGLPQNRAMVYFVFLRTDALAFEANACMDKIRDIMSAAAVESCPTFQEFFANSGDVLSAKPALKTNVDPRCTCSFFRCCERHRCNCKICTRAGRQTRFCRWRSDTSRYLRRTARARAEYLRRWRLVKKNAKLKRSPTYFELTRARGINIDGLKNISPRQRVMLNSFSMCQNLLGKDVIIDMAKCISKPVTIRSDGVVPNLGRCCSRLLVPSVAQLISARQCLRLQGVDPSAIDLTGMKDDDIFRMVGSAMCLPAIGTLLMACISVLRW